MITDFDIKTHPSSHRKISIRMRPTDNLLKLTVSMDQVLQIFGSFIKIEGVCFPWYVNELNESIARTSKPKLFSETSSNLTIVGGLVFNLSIFI